jgi:uncharacterized protein (TIGR02246 family)
MRETVVILTVSVLALACSPPPERPEVQEPVTEEKADVYARLMELENGAMERWRTGDPSGYLELMADEYSYFDPGVERRMDGRDAMAAYFEPIKDKIHYEGSEFLDPAVQTYGDAAVLSYNYVSSGVGEDGLPWRTPWNVTEVYARLRGDWRLVHSHFAYTGGAKPEDLDLPDLETAAVPQDDQLLRALLALEDRAMERWRRGDPWGFIELSAPDVTYFDPDLERRLDGREALADLYRQIEGKILYDGSTFANPRVQRHGKLAVLTFNYVSSRPGAGGAGADKTYWNTTEVYARRDEAWRIVHTHWSYVKGSL